MTTAQARIDEKAMNGYIARAMELMAPPGYTVWPEVHGLALTGGTSPDIVVRMPYDLRMIVETEYGAPALDDAKHRLGYEFGDRPQDVKNVIALGIPYELGDPNIRHRDRDAQLMSKSADFSMQIVTGKSLYDPETVVTPEAPIAVSLRDVIQYAWLAAIPESYTTMMLSNVTALLRAARNELSQRLSAQNDSDQELEWTNRIGFKYGNPDSASPSQSAAGNIVGTLFSMVELHRNLTHWGQLRGVLPIDADSLWNSFTGEGIARSIAAEWRKIETVDYRPLSTIAADMLQDGDISPQLGATLKTVRRAVADNVPSGLSATTNIAAAVWQELTPDRDERAVNYTRPHRAEFLANITTERLKEPGKAYYAEVCAGTGTLARASEENIRFRHYADTKDKSSIHAERMERYIQLTDISQQSVSVATSNLTSLEPQTTFGKSAIFAITATGGSLNLLSEEGVGNMGSQLIGSYGEEGAMLAIDPGRVDICCNNDPYFRSRGGARNPISSQEMQKYKRKADRRLPGVANGQAGLATFMHVIEHEMLAKGAPHGKVLPLTAAHAGTYAGFRRNIENNYRDVIAVSTAAGEGESMSDDTDKQEMLLIGTKQKQDEGAKSVICVNLTDDFQNKIQAKMYADAIRVELAKGLPYGDITIGQRVGTYYRMGNLGDGRPWSALGTSGAYTQLTEFLTRGIAWESVSGTEYEFTLPMTFLGGASDIGPTHHLLGGVADVGPTHELLGSVPTSRDPRGAFLMVPADASADRLNPSMWQVDSQTQTSIACLPTHYGVPRDDPQLARRMLATSGHFHLSRNLRQSSQAIVMAYTEIASMGGSSWTTVTAPLDVSKAVALYLNSTFGIVVRIGYGQSTDVGRSRIQVEAISSHPVPDFAEDSKAGQDARDIAVANFDELRNLPLRRISLSAVDPNRAKIDEVVAEMLGLEWNTATKNMLDAWRRLMCQQTLVHNNTRETIAELKRAGVIP